MHSVVSDAADAGFPRLRVAVSACLLGEAVRYDGRHKRDAFIATTLARFMKLVPLCPETAIGLGVPRPPIRLEGDLPRPEAVGVEDPSLNVTGALEAYGYETAERLGARLSACILKKDSPSCGPRGVKLYSGRGGAARPEAMGTVARILSQRLPLLPMEQEDRLHDPIWREVFLTRAYTWRRWQDLMATGLSAEGLAAFHAAHRCLLAARSQASLWRIDQDLSRLSDDTVAATAQVYIAAVMDTLARPASHAGRLRVLEQLAHGLKGRIDSPAQARLREALMACRQGQVPLTVPVQRLREHLRAHPDALGPARHCLYPYPDALGLHHGG